MQYKNVVFTKHAQERLADRSITPDSVYQVIHYPDRQQDQGEATKFIRQLNQRKYHVVASYLKDEQKWLVISVWVRGEDDPVPVVWWLLTAPFRLGWWMLQKLAQKLR